MNHPIGAGHLDIINCEQAITNLLLVKLLMRLFILRHTKL